MRIQEDTRACVLFILSFKPSYILVEGHYCDLLLARHTGPHYHHNSHHGLLRSTARRPLLSPALTLPVHACTCVCEEGMHAHRGTRVCYVIIHIII